MHRNTALLVAYDYLKLQVEGEVTYNGRTFNEFIPLRTATYVEQSDTVSAFIL